MPPVMHTPAMHMPPHYTCPLVMHATSHACPQAYTPPAMHTPSLPDPQPCTPPAVHIPPPHIPPSHACPQPCMPQAMHTPSHACPQPCTPPPATPTPSHACHPKAMHTPSHAHPKPCMPPPPATHSPLTMHAPPTVNRMTHASENITFPQLRLRAVIKGLNIQRQSVQKRRTDFKLAKKIWVSTL